MDHYSDESEEVIGQFTPIPNPNKANKKKKKGLKHKLINEIYCPSDYCFECVLSQGRKCKNCEECKPQAKVLSLKPFYEGPLRKRIKPSLICSIHCKYDIVRHVASKLGMKESLENWNVLWSDFTVTCERIKNLKKFQKVNHFPGMIEICRKDLLARNLNRMHKLFPNDYSFFPPTWILPTDYTEVLEFAKTHKNKTYILKPELGCKGKGIFLTKNLRQLSGLERTICQVYVSKPFLIDGFKFDLRVYALLTSCDPLRLYVYNEGLARFATKFYEDPNKSNMANMYMHLTNYSVNKFSRSYKMDPEDGSKRKLSTLNDTLRNEYHDVTKIWKEIDDVIIKTVFLALPTLQHSYRVALPRGNNTKTCFEILGFDLILDENLRPHLLEVNHSPSFHTDAPIDREVKESLLIDTFKLLDLPKNTRNKIIQEEKKKATNRLLKDLQPDQGWSKDRYDSCDIEETMRRSDIFELENIGNFRRIYPTKDSDKYDKYFCQGISSLYNETFASRARERATKLDLESMDRRVGDSAPLIASNAPLSKDKSFEWIFNKMKSEKCLEKIKEELPKRQLSIIKTQEAKESKDAQYLPNIRLDYFAKSPLEERRITRFTEKQEILESVNVLEKIHTTMKTFGELRLRNDIRKARKNEWSKEAKSVEKRISLQNTLSDVIKKIEESNLVSSLSASSHLHWNYMQQLRPNTEM